VISEIIVNSADTKAVELDIVWIGGLRQELRVPRTGAVDALIAEARKAGKDSAAIAAHLRTIDIPTRRGTPMQRHAVYGALKRVGLNTSEQRRQVFLLIRQLIIDQCPHAEMLKIVQKEAPPALGNWTRERLNQYVSKLYRGVPGVPALPKPLPSELDRQTVLDVIRRRHAEGIAWSVVAAELNASDLRPPRATAFTATQVAMVFSRWKRQQRQSGTTDTVAS
jgi:hypothetical protein